MKKARLGTVLREILDQVGADYYIEADHIRVTTAAIKELVTGPRRTLPELRPVDDGCEAPQLEASIQARHAPTVTARLCVATAVALTKLRSVNRRIPKARSPSTSSHSRRKCRTSSPC